MNQVTINQLPELTGDVDDNYMLAIDDGTTTKKVKVGHFEEAASNTARQYAEAASESASDASDSAAAAAQTAENIEDDIAAAQRAVDDARRYASAASDAVTSAQEASSAAGRSANSAANSANAAADSVTEAAIQEAAARIAAAIAKSWADYPNQSAEGSATNNAHYWADQARAIAGGGVTTFNNRTGAVVPEAGDYNGSMIDYDNTTSGMTADDVQEAIDELSGDVSTVETALTGKENAPTVLTGTLSVGATSLTFTNAGLVSTAVIDIYTDKYGVAPTDADNSTSGTLVLTFDPQESAVSVKVYIRG